VHLHFEFCSLWRFRQFVYYESVIQHLYWYCVLWTPQHFRLGAPPPLNRKLLLLNCEVTNGIDEVSGVLDILVEFMVELFNNK
jgi:hypothetical protein